MAFLLVCCPTCGDVWARDIDEAGPLPIGARSEPDCVYSSCSQREHSEEKKPVFVVDVLPGDYYERDGEPWERARNPFRHPDDVEVVRYHALAVLFAGHSGE